jgi:hypothetical protein
MSNRAKGRLNLYEIVNYDRRESLLALVTDGIGPLVTRLKSPRPRPIEHWGPTELFAVEQIAAGVSAAEAEIFLAFFLGNVRWMGWKMLVWRG